MHPFIQFKRATPIILALALACVGLSRSVQAVSPAPDGCYPNFTTAEGCNALAALTTGSGNTALGWRSLFSNSDGSFNTGVGAGVLALNNADSNTAVGAAAMLLNTSGRSNTAVGAQALLHNTDGILNTAVGYQALLSNTTGAVNTADGVGALLSNTTGESNTANGFQALFSNTTGNFNTASGTVALQNNTTGGSNTAIGSEALEHNTTGGGNTATGLNALNSNSTGIHNTAIGVGALFSNTVGSNNVALGYAAGTVLTTGSVNIDIGNIGVAGESGTIRIGNALDHTRTFIAAIRGVTTGNNNAVPVLIDSAGQFGTISSSRRFKKDIQPMDKSSEVILGLKPVTFHYKSDKTSTPQFGLIAEEVADVDPDLVVCDDNGEIYTVRYDQVNAMLLNEFLKEHKKVEKEEAMITRLTNDFQTVSTQQRNEIQLLSTQLKEQAAQIQKVSAQLEASKPAPRTVKNND